MAYTWDDKGNITGIVDGARFDTSGVAKYLQELQKATANTSLFGMMGGNANDRGTLASGFSKFSYDANTGKVKGWIPEVKPASNMMGMGIGMNQGPQPVMTQGPMMGFGAPAQERGLWADIEGVVLDPKSLSGKAEGDLDFKMDGGAPLAEFKSGGQTVGYMRFATQQAKAPDKVNLSNNSGTNQRASNNRSLLAR